MCIRDRYLFNDSKCFYRFLLIFLVTSMLEIGYVGDMFEMLVTDFQHDRRASKSWLCPKVVASITLLIFVVLWIPMMFRSRPNGPAGSKLGRPIGSHGIVLVHRILLRRSVYASIIGSYQLNWYKLFLAIFDQFRFNKWFWLVDWDLRIGTWCVFDSRYLK